MRRKEVLRVVAIRREVLDPVIMFIVAVYRVVRCIG